MDVVKDSMEGFINENGQEIFEGISVGGGASFSY